MFKTNFVFAFVIAFCITLLTACTYINKSDKLAHYQPISTSQNNPHGLKILVLNPKNAQQYQSLVEQILAFENFSELDLADISVYLTPGSSSEINQEKFKQLSTTQIQYTYHPEQLSNQFVSQLAYHIYLLKRQMAVDITDESERQISEALASHFAGIKQQSDAFSLIEKHFIHYPGSNAANVYALPASYFKQPYSKQKHTQFERTAGEDVIKAQQQVNWDENGQKGVVFSEGWNNKKYIALTFDDGPDVKTKAILDQLDNYQVKASFFWVGRKLEENKQLVERAQKSGHTIANHSWSHPYGTELTPQALWQQQVVKTNRKFKEIIGYQPRFYRPPYGDINDQQIDYLKSQGIKVIIWSIDPKDWNTTEVDAKDISQVVIHNAHSEAIVLLHDGHAKPSTLNSLPQILEYYQQQGFEFVTLEKLLGIGNRF